MSKNPKISVIMSVYNGMPLGPHPALRGRTASSAYSQKSSAYLKQAVESILNQTYRNFEFIIVDDASKDKTWSYLKSLKDPRVKIIKNKKNLGLAASLNIALRLAQGDYVARMDADDVSLPKRFETQIRFLESHQDIDLCGTWVDLINEKGIKIGEKKYPTSDNAIKKALSWYPPIIHPTFVAKASVFRSLNGYNPKFELAEDYELLMRAKSKFKFANLPKKLLLWRLWDRRRSRDSWDKMEKIDLKIKSEALKRGDFSPLYIFVVFGKFIITYIFPYRLKLWVFKVFKLI